MERISPATAVLAVGTVLMLAALWRGWRPGLRTALAVGVALRVAVWGLTARGVPQPWDFANDFQAAGAAVLHHQDPVLSNPGRWHLLPLMPFVLAAELKVGQVAHLSWPLIGKLAPIAADVVLIPLVGRLAGNRGRQAAFQYACNPVSIMVCALHGQLEPVSLALGVGAFLVARSGRAGTAGLLGGLSAATGGWPVLLLPGIFLSLPLPKRPAGGGPGLEEGRLSALSSGLWEVQWRQWLRAAVCAAAVPVLLLVSSPLTVGTPIRQLPHVARLLIGARSVIGDWGWTAVATAGAENGNRALAQLGKLLLIAALVGTLYLWRRADPLRLTTALLITFLVLTPRLGVQYLMFPVPFLVALGSRFTAGAVLASAAWQGAGYFYLGKLTYDGWLSAHRWWALSSLVVIGCLVAAMPWAGRDRQGTDAAAGRSGTGSPEESASVGSADGILPGDAVPAWPAD